MRMAKPQALRLPVVSAGAEFLVMGLLIRRNTLAFKDGRDRDQGTCVPGSAGRRVVVE